MRTRSALTLAAATAAAVALVAACADAPTAENSIAAHAGHAGHDDPLLSQFASPEIRQKIIELRQWSAEFHNLDKAAEAGYYANIGCIDQTTGGADPSGAIGMGYHVTNGDRDIIMDGVVNIDEPEFLVYAPHPDEADIPPEDRLKAARLVGFDYFIFDTDSVMDPPEFFGEKFNWNPTFRGWMRHIYLWGNNPDGMFADYNPKTPLCADPIVI